MFAVDRFLKEGERTLKIERVIKTKNFEAGNVGINTVCARIPCFKEGEIPASLEEGGMEKW